MQNAKLKLKTRAFARVFFILPIFSCNRERFSVKLRSLTHKFDVLCVTSSALLSVTPSVILSGAKNNLSFSSAAKNLDCFLRSRSFAKWSCEQRNEAKPPQAGSALSLLNVCSALVTFITYHIPFTFKCYLLQAACHKLFGDPAARCHTLRSRFCCTPLCYVSQNFDSVGRFATFPRSG